MHEMSEDLLCVKDSILKKSDTNTKKNVSISDQLSYFNDEDDGGDGTDEIDDKVTRSVATSTLPGFSMEDYLNSLDSSLVDLSKINDHEIKGDLSNDNRTRSVNCNTLYAVDIFSLNSTNQDKRKTKEERKREREKKKEEELLLKYQIEQENKHKAIAKSKCGRWVKFNIKIGEGGYKFVYKGYDVQEARNIAWCEFKREHVDTKEKRQAMVRETDLMLKMNHSNIVRCFGVLSIWDVTEDSVRTIEEKGIVIIQELMGEGTLKNIIKKNFVSGECILRSSLILEWCHQVLDALKYMHQKCVPPIIHRDLKADNCFLYSQADDECLNVKVGDFGLATHVKTSGRKTMLGTMGFMAPEIFEEKYDESVDIYAFGMLMLEVMTNRTPFDDCDTLVQVAAKTLCGEGPVVLEMVQDKCLQEIIKICIHPMSCYRPTAEELYLHPKFHQTKGLILEVELNYDKIAKRIEEYDTFFATFPTNTKVNLRLKFREKRMQQELGLDDTESLEFDLDVYKGADQDIPELIQNLRSEYEDKLIRFYDNPKITDKRTIDANLDKLFSSIRLQLQYLVKYILGKRWRDILDRLVADMSKKNDNGEDDPDNEDDANEGVGVRFAGIGEYKKLWSRAKKLLDKEIQLYRETSQVSTSASSVNTQPTPPPINSQPTPPPTSAQPTISPTNNNELKHIPSTSTTPSSIPIANNVGQDTTENNETTYPIPRDDTQVPYAQTSPSLVSDFLNPVDIQEVSIATMSSVNTNVPQVTSSIGQLDVNNNPPCNTPVAMYPPRMSMTNVAAMPPSNSMLNNPDDISQIQHQMVASVPQQPTISNTIIQQQHNQRIDPFIASEKPQSLQQSSSKPSDFKDPIIPQHHTQIIDSYSHFTQQPYHRDNFCNYSTLMVLKIKIYGQFIKIKISVTIPTDSGKYSAEFKILTPLSPQPDSSTMDIPQLSQMTSLNKELISALQQTLAVIIQQVCINKDSFPLNTPFVFYPLSDNSILDIYCDKGSRDGSVTQFKNQSNTLERSETNPSHFDSNFNFYHELEELFEGNCKVLLSRKLDDGKEPAIIQAYQIPLGSGLVVNGAGTVKNITKTTLITPKTQPHSDISLRQFDMHDVSMETSIQILSNLQESIVETSKSTLQLNEDFHSKIFRCNGDVKLTEESVAELVSENERDQNRIFKRQQLINMYQRRPLDTASTTNNEDPASSKVFRKYTMMPPPAQSGWYDFNDSIHQRYLSQGRHIVPLQTQGPYISGYTPGEIPASSQAPPQHVPGQVPPGPYISGFTSGDMTTSSQAPLQHVPGQVPSGSYISGYNPGDISASSQAPPQHVPGQVPTGPYISGFTSGDIATSSQAPPQHVTGQCPPGPFISGYNHGEMSASSQAPPQHVPAQVPTGPYINGYTPGEIPTSSQAPPQHVSGQVPTGPYMGGYAPGDISVSSQIPPMQQQHMPTGSTVSQGPTPPHNIIIQPNFYHQLPHHTPHHQAAVPSNSVPQYYNPNDEMMSSLPPSFIKDVLPSVDMPKNPIDGGISVSTETTNIDSVSIQAPTVLPTNQGLDRSILTESST